MATAPNSSVLEGLLEPLSQCFTLEVAQRLVDLRADVATQARLDDLADRCTEGTLSPEELREYDSYVHAIDLISILQAKARAILRASSRS